MSPGRARLLSLLRETKAAGDEMEGEASRFALISGSGPTRAVSSFNLFQTPEWLADKMAELAAGCPSPWLEPSAGLGRLYRAARKVYNGPIVLVEPSPDCAGELYASACERAGDRLATLRQGGFLGYSSADLGGPFGAVVMNPPFKHGRDVHHIKHAMGMLAPGGLLVALCYNGVRQRAELAPLASSWEVIQGAFRESGTDAEVVLLTIRS